MLIILQPVNNSITDGSKFFGFLKNEILKKIDISSIDLLMWDTPFKVLGRVGLTSSDFFNKKLKIFATNYKLLISFLKRNLNSKIGMFC